MSKKSPEATVEMSRSWLVQRLDPSQQHHSILGKDNPFSFGGGMRNGGLSDDAMDLLRPVFSFDYMGAAEFEFGEVPKALTKIAKAGQEDLAASSIVIELKDVKAHYSDRSKKAPEGSAEIFILARGSQMGEVERRIRGWAKDPYSNESQAKESINLSSVLRPGDYEPRTKGWLELDNGFMFFVDRDMWAATCELFGVKVEVSA
jgi:hypothetical protein